MSYGPDEPDITYVPQAYEEHLYDTGEINLSYATTGNPDNPAILLIPHQSESWWGFEAAMAMLADNFQVFAVSLRGQGRSSRTPGRYTFDNYGNDLVRFGTGVIKKPFLVSGLSSGGIVAAWLSAYSPVGIVRGAHYEDPPLFASELDPPCGPGLFNAAGPMLRFMHKYLGNQWSIGDVAGMLEAAPKELPEPFAAVIPLIVGTGDAVSQNIKEYDPEVADAFCSGAIGASCDHATMLSRVKCPILFTHHEWRMLDNGDLYGAISGEQVDLVEKLITEAGQPFERKSFPDVPHAMHAVMPELFVETVTSWAMTLS